MTTDHADRASVPEYQRLTLDAYDFELPADRIAQHPPDERDGGRMMCVDRMTGDVEHDRVRALPDRLRRGDLLVVNATRVRPARLRGRKASGGAADALLIEEVAPGQFRALVRHGGRQRVGLKYRFGAAALDAELVELEGDGIVRLAFDPDADPYAYGEPPLPPYIRRDAPEPGDIERYQTTFARVPGSVAAPTAGLHLTDSLVATLDARGVERAEVILHVGLGTFRPLTEADLARGRLHEEQFELPPETADAIARTRGRGGRVVAVGTTVTRVLEHCANADRGVTPGSGRTDLFLAPGAAFQVVDVLMTNFHLPRSSLLMLVAAFAGREATMRAYAEAVRSRYHFYSYGDAMLIQSS